MDISKYISDKALILIPCLYVIGVILKQSKFFIDKNIPLALLIIGVFGALGLLGISMDSVIQGILCAGTAVLTNELIRQSNKFE